MVTVTDATLALIADRSAAATSTPTVSLTTAVARVAPTDFVTSASVISLSVPEIVTTPLTVTPETVAFPCKPLKSVAKSVPDASSTVTASAAPLSVRILPKLVVTSEPVS